MTHDSPAASYFEAILIAIRGAGHKMVALGGYLGSAEKAPASGWKWQLLAAATCAHAEALDRLDEAEARLGELGTAADLPPPLDQLPERLAAMRADLRGAEQRIEKAQADAAGGALGSA